MFDQILDLVGQPPGSLVYHFIILFAVEAAFAIAIGQWMRERDSGTLRLVVSIFVIFLGRVLILVASLAASAIFVVPVMSSAGSGGGRPDMVVLSAVQNAPIAAIAPVFGHDADSFAKALRSKGFTVVSADQSLLDVAAASGKSTRDVMFALPRR